MANPEWTEPEDWDDEVDDGCYECGGEGFVAHCFTEYACVHPEDGCALCFRACDFCAAPPRDAA